MADNKLYKVAVTLDGNYVHGKEYDKLVQVFYDEADGGDGCSYVSRKRNVNVRPGTDDTVWQKCSERGAQGIQGQDGQVGPAGSDGADGAPAGFGIPTVSISGGVGTPSVQIASSGPDTEKIFSFTFNNLKGETGQTGQTGQTGPQGPAGVTSVVVTVDGTSGTPSATSSVEDGVLSIELSGLKGEQGNSGYSGASGELEVVNNDNDGGETSAWSAERGKQIRADFTQLETEVNDNDVKFGASDVIVQIPVDFSRLALRNYSLNESGSYGTGNTYKHCLVPVSEGEVYRIVPSGNTTRYAFFTSNAASTSGGDAPLVTGTARMNVEVGTEKIVTIPATCTYLYIYRGASPYSYTPTHVSKLVSKSGLSYITPENVNLIDPSKIIGGYVDNSGKVYESEDYYQTDYIAVDENTDYTVLCKTWSNTYYYRYVCFYDSAKVKMSGGISTTGKTFTTPAGCAYCIVSLYDHNGSTEIDPSNYGLFKGTSPSFVPYYANTIEIADVPYAKKGNNAVVTKKDLDGVISETVENLNGVPPMTLKYTNPGIKITAPGYENTCSLDRHYLPQFKYSSNHIFNFDNLAFGDASSSTMDDDVAPSHFQNTTLGANHAQPTQIATITGHGKTNEDIGTAWVKGSTTFYIVRIVDENSIEFLSENKGTYNNHNFVALTTGTITKGAESMTITAISNSQLWSSAANKQQRIVLDGNKEVTAAGTYKCHFADIVESYDMVNSADVITNLIARVGSDDDPVYTGSSMLRFENIYRFYPGGQVLVMENVVALQQVPMQDIMFNQAARFGTNGNVKYYVPNSKAFDGYDFRTPLLVTWSSSLPAFNFTSDYWNDANNPPNRVVMIKSTTGLSNGYGFALGFLPYGVGKSLKDYTTNAFELRNNTGKIYPHGVHGNKVGTTMAAGMAYNAVMYRVPFAPQPSHRIAYYTIPFEDSIYAFVDYAQSKNEVLEVGDEWNGKPIEVIQAVNCNLLTDVYNHGFRVKADYVSGETCFLVVKIG